MGMLHAKHHRHGIRTSSVVELGGDANASHYECGSDVLLQKRVHGLSGT